MTYSIESYANELAEAKMIVMDVDRETGSEFVRDFEEKLTRLKAEIAGRESITKAEQVEKEIRDRAAQILPSIR